MTGNPVTPNTASFEERALMNILLLGMGGNVTQGILKAIRASQLHCRIVGACVASSAAGLYMCDAAYISPYASDSAFLPWLRTVCLTERIDAVLSGVEEVLEILAAHRESLEEELHARFIVSGAEQLRIGNDKLETCRWLRHNNFSYPPFAVSEDADGVKLLAAKTGCRLIAKPRRSKSSHGIIRLRTEDDLRHIAGLAGYVVQEEIGTEREEYTVGCYTDKKGNFAGAIVMRRELQNGTTCKATVVRSQTIEREAAAICAAFRATGPLNIQLRLDAEARPIPFEVNVRFSGTTPMRACFGFNDVEAALREYVLNEDVSGCFSVRSGTALRYWEEIYIDADAENALNEHGGVAAMPAHGPLPQQHRTK